MVRVTAIALGTATLLCVAGFDDDDFTADERARLERGQLVSRPTERRRGQSVLVGGVSWLRVTASADSLWRIARDPGAYAHILPAAEEARVVARGESGVIVRIRHRYGLVGAAYHASLRFDDSAHMLSFSLDRTRPHDIRQGYGFMMITRVDDTHADVTWGAMADVGSDVVAGMLRPLMQEWMLRVPECLRGWALHRTQC